MKQLKKSEKILAISVAGLLVVWVISNMLGGGGSNPGYQPQGADVLPGGLVQPPEEALGKKADEAALFSYEFKVDPFVKFPKKKAGASGLAELTLEGVLWDDKKPYAVINGEVFGVGQSVGDYKVIDIQKDNVTLSGKGKTHNLKLEDQ